MAKKKGSTYEVGYGKPPREKRFPAGVSGNPKGRPRGSQNLTTTFSRMMNEKVTVLEGGRKKSITKLEAAMKQLFRQALNGNMPAMKQFLSHASLAELKAESAHAREQPLGRTEARMLKSLAKQFEKMTEGGEL